MCPISMVWETAEDSTLRQAGNLYLVGTTTQRENLRSPCSHAAITLEFYGRNVQRSLIAIKSLCGTRLTRGSVTMRCQPRFQDRKSTRLNSSHLGTSYA